MADLHVWRLGPGHLGSFILIMNILTNNHILNMFAKV